MKKMIIPAFYALLAVSNTFCVIEGDTPGFAQFEMAVKRANVDGVTAALKDPDLEEKDINKLLLLSARHLAGRTSHHEMPYIALAFEPSHGPSELSSGELAYESWEYVGEDDTWLGWKDGEKSFLFGAFGGGAFDCLGEDPSLKEVKMYNARVVNRLRTCWQEHPDMVPLSDETDKKRMAIMNKLVAMGGNPKQPEMMEAALGSSKFIYHLPLVQRIPLCRYQYEEPWISKAPWYARLLGPGTYTRPSWCESLVSWLLNKEFSPKTPVAIHGWHEVDASWSYGEYDTCAESQSAPGVTPLQYAQHGEDLWKGVIPKPLRFREHMRAYSVPRWEQLLALLQQFAGAAKGAPAECAAGVESEKVDGETLAAPEILS